MENLPQHLVVRADVAKYYIFSGTTAFSLGMSLLHAALGLWFYFFGAASTGVTLLVLSGLMIGAAYINAFLVRRIRARLTRNAESFVDLSETKLS